MTVVIQYDTSHLNLKSEDLSSNTFVETKTLFPSLKEVEISNLSLLKFLVVGLSVVA